MDKIYNSDYYNRYSEHSYAKAEVWESFFGSVADRIVADFNPRVVLDAGCAWGYLVAALRDRGVDAYGLDVSTYAIDHVRDDIRPYCFVGSLTEPFPASLPDKFDLITSIEVLEHIDEEQCMTVIEQLCSRTDQILFSSTSEDIQDETHVNVQQPEYWMKRFAQFGFYRQIQYNAENYLSPDAVYLRRTDDIPGIISSYERLSRQMKTKSVANEKVKSKADLFIDHGEGYTCTNKITRTVTSDDFYSETYHFSDSPPKRLRFGPTDGAAYVVRNIKIYSNQGILSAININGTRVVGFDFFSVPDPIFEIDLDGQEIDWIRIECGVHVIKDSIKVSFLNMIERIMDKHCQQVQMLEKQAG